MCTALSTVAVVVVVIALLFLFVPTCVMQKEIRGVVEDCATGAPVSGVRITASQRGLGWGDNGPLIDKTYAYATRSDASGHFVLRYRIGRSAQLWAERTGYAKAMQTEQPGNNVVVRMVQADRPHELTIRCRASSECTEIRIENGEKIARSICGP